MSMHVTTPLAQLGMLLLFACAGCEGLQKDSEPPREPSKMLFLTIGDPVTNGPPVGTFQDALDGWAYMFDNADPESPKYLCQHDDPGTVAKAIEVDAPLAEPCAPAPPPPSPPPAPDPGSQPWTGSSGKNPFPVAAESWVGVAAGGGCGVWSVAMCDRILGLTDASSAVTQPEWSAIATKIKLDPSTGASSWVDRAQYYRDKGYCTEHKLWTGTAEELAEVTERFNEGKCDVKMRFYKIVGDEAVNGHVETVTGATLGGVITNSWGSEAIVNGGTGNGFSHQVVKGPQMTESDGSPLWPAASAEVWIDYVCPCTMFEKLGQLILGGN